LNISGKIHDQTILTPRHLWTEFWMGARSVMDAAVSRELQQQKT